MQINTFESNFIKHVITQRKNKTTNSSCDSFNFGEYLHSKLPDCPYSALAQDGVIQYNGVTFICDSDTNSICLGDMSNPKKVLNIPLSSGGHLKVNVDNLDAIPQASGMFSAEDMGAILRAISEYKHCTSKLEEIEEEENEAVEEATEATATAPTFQIGSESMTLEEWDKLLSNFDSIQEDVKEEVEEMKERHKENAALE